jgi:sigma-B regulation protein RsbU (phosphoserine phosphatase)
MAPVMAPASSLRVLVGDDQHAVLEAVRFVLKGEGHTAVTVDNPAAVLHRAEKEPFDLILIDLNYTRDTTSGQEGLDLLGRLQSAGVEAPVIVMTAWGTVELAVEAMRRGACDFIQKPWDNARLLDTIRKQANQAAERTTKRRHWQTEIEIAHNIQQKLLPQPTATLRTARYAARCCPAGDVGGDYYDFIEMDSSIGFVLADVSGKGIGAALLMANLQASLRTRMSHASVDVPAVLQDVSKAFFESTSVEHYATMVFGRYDDSTRQFQYINAGHLAPMLLRSGGQVERLEPTSTPIGMLPHWHSLEKSITIDRGDTLVMFSDGVVENGFENGREFGEAALSEALLARQGLAPESLVTDLTKHVLSYSSTQHDDLTLVAIQGI